MDKREALKSMLNNLINDRPEEASMDLHNYLTDKMRDVSGLASASASSDDEGTGSEVDLDDDDNDPTN